MYKSLKIPEATVIRLSVYSRFLDEMERRGVITISSVEIAEGAGVSPAQVRKDLAYFGEFGTRGVGYNVKDLYRHLTRILGLNHQWSLVIVGAGNLGTALCLYGGFRKRGFRVVGMFDNDPHKIGLRLNHIEVYPMDSLSSVVERERVEIGIVAVPAEAAQDAADVLVGSGVKAILNFAPRVINVPPQVELRSVDLAVNLEILTFNLNMRLARD